VPGVAELVYSDTHWLEAEWMIEPTWRHWDELPPETWMSNFDVLCFLSPVAYRFYLAAFLHTALKLGVRYLMLVDFARYGLPPQVDAFSCRSATRTGSSSASHRKN
jgi:hypothetical protein